jgi:hypothetical protein
MSKPQKSYQLFDEDAEYFEICVKGHLSPSWSEYFGGLDVINEQGGEARLSGSIADQAELHGVLARIRDLNLTLVSVTHVAREQRPDDCPTA